jgi:hypothetical protein
LDAIPQANRKTFRRFNTSQSRQAQKAPSATLTAISSAAARRRCSRLAAHLDDATDGLAPLIREEIDLPLAPEEARAVDPAGDKNADDLARIYIVEHSCDMSFGHHDCLLFGVDRSAPGDRQGVDGASPSR